MLSTTQRSEFGLLATIRKLSVYQLITFAVLALACRWLLRGIWRVYFHRLSRFPGPRISAFTRLPHLIAVSKGRLPQYIARLHDEYGEVVRISPDELSFLHSQAWRDIYGLGSKVGKGKAPPKNWNRYGKQVNGVDHLVTMENPTKHANSRKIFSSAFSDRALTQQAPLFTKYVNQLVGNLSKIEKDGATVDMVRMYNFTTFDVMGDLTFGESLHMLDNAEYDPWVKLIFEEVKLGVLLGLVSNYYPLINSIFRKLTQKTVEKIRYEHFDYCVTRVTKRLEKGRASEGVDLWDLVLQQEEKGKELMPRKEMDSNTSLFMIAGTETTATLLSGLTYLLLTHPESMKKLADEVRGAFPSSDSISMEAIAGLPYLNACIKEGLRRYPPVPVGLPHQTPLVGSTICGHYVPPKVTVASHHYPMYCSSKFFKDPLAFVPERWTGDERYANDDRAVLQPFSVGPRDCLGKNMAYHEMRLILAKVVYNFDFELRPESMGWLDQSVYTLWEKKKLLVNLKAVSG